MRPKVIYGAFHITRFRPFDFRMGLANSLGNIAICRLSFALTLVFGSVGATNAQNTSAATLEAPASGSTASRPLSTKENQALREEYQARPRRVYIGPNTRGYEALLHGMGSKG